MLELALSLFDYMIKLIERREGNIDEYFEIYIKPAYEIGENVNLPKLVPIISRQI